MANRFGVFCVVVAVSLFVGGSVSIVRGVSDQRSVAQTKDLGDIPILSSSNQPTVGRYMSFATPLSIFIPSAGINSPLITVGKAPDGTIDSPKAPDFDKAAWYHNSPAPGQYGAAIIVGHVDSYANGNGASVFYNLAKLKPGDIILVGRSDSTTATFKVYAIRQFARNNMPIAQVYSPNSANAELRLITCAGAFDTSVQEYTSNTVVFAHLADS